MIDSALNKLSVKRGSELPHAKLNEVLVRRILKTVQRRDQLKKRLAKLTNDAIAKKYGVHRRTIDRITAGENWIHVL